MTATSRNRGAMHARKGFKQMDVNIEVQAQTEDRLAAALEPESYLPSQHFSRGEHGPGAGVKRMMIAMLEDAIDVYRKHASTRGGKHERAFREAERWFELRDRSWLFSFESVCDTLGINANRLRQALAVWRHAQKPQGRGRFLILRPRPTAPRELARAVGE
jgi:hypothetical protein